MFVGWGIPDFVALLLGGAIPGATAGLGIGALIRAIRNRSKHSRR